MGRIEDLDLGDSGPPQRDDLRRQRTQAQIFLREVLDMLESGDYDFAWGYLKSLSLTLEKTDRVTAAQREAVENIKAGKERHDEQLDRWQRHERRTGRRYEGFSGKNR